MLTDTGHTDIAYRLLTRRTFPSCGYQIDRSRDGPDVPCRIRLAGEGGCRPMGATPRG
ncbi:hypothetical protein RKD47_000057 [Streptomyces albogriseolus]